MSIFSCTGPAWRPGRIKGFPASSIIPRAIFMISTTCLFPFLSGSPLTTWTENFRPLHYQWNVFREYTHKNFKFFCEQQQHIKFMVGFLLAEIHVKTPIQLLLTGFYSKFYFKSSGFFRIGVFRKGCCFQQQVPYIVYLSTNTDCDYSLHVKILKGSFDLKFWEKPI